MHPEEETTDDPSADHHQCNRPWPERSGPTGLRFGNASPFVPGAYRHYADSSRQVRAWRAPNFQVGDETDPRALRGRVFVGGRESRESRSEATQTREPVEEVAAIRVPGWQLTTDS